MNKHKSRSVTLRTATHSLLSNLSEVIVPGYTLSIPSTIDLIANKVSGSMGTKNEGTADDAKKKNWDEDILKDLKTCQTCWKSSKMRGHTLTRKSTCAL